MWLDRFSGHSSPAGPSPPQSRNYSPAPPRRSAHLAPSQRGLGLNAGGSALSLNLSSNASNTSLPPTSKLSNGSSLRYERDLPSNGPDPLDILRSILGTLEPNRGADEGQEHGEDVSKYLRAADDVGFGGLSLQEYVEAESQPKSAGTKVVSAEDIKATQKTYEELHTSIRECDNVLKSVETYLTNFQVELGAVSAEIESLQNRSMELNAQLEKRREVEKILGPAVEELSLSPW